MVGRFHTSGYIAEIDLKAITLEHNDKLNRKIKSTLLKIHKLKRENLVLNDRRYSKYLKLREFDSTTLVFLDIFLEVLKISERIGKNGNKIQRLRTKISQLKKSLIPVVDE